MGKTAEDGPKSVGVDEVSGGVGRIKIETRDQKSG